MIAPSSFNLVDEHWIEVVTLEGAREMHSLSSVLREAHRIKLITAELPTMEFALHRLLLAVLYRAIISDDPVATWRALWNRAELPDEIQQYLVDYADRFDLLDSQQPFFQVADLHTRSGDVSGLERLIADVPNGSQYFTTRAAEHLRAISFGEAARWLVHAQAFDPSGIKSGAVGDPRVKGGKGYPIGTAWAGNLGGLLIEGNSLRETLLLNLRLENPGQPGVSWSREHDLPVWERPPLGAAEEKLNATTGPIPGRAPTGPADLLTWPSRRIRLSHDADRVTGVLIANGDRLWPQNRFGTEPMTGWRLSEPQTKKYSATMYMPRQHTIERSLWRGLGSLLPSAESTTTTASGDPGRPAPTLMWVSDRIEDPLPSDFLIRIRAVGIAYGSNSSVVDDLYDDTVETQATVLASRSLQACAVEAVEHSESAVRTLADLARDLEVAAGGEGIASRSRTLEQGYHRLDAPFRQWLLELSIDTDADSALFDWFAIARSMIRGVADQLVAAAPPGAWRGRNDSRGEHIDVGVADRRFRFRLDEKLPRPETSTHLTTGGNPNAVSL